MISHLGQMVDQLPCGGAAIGLQALHDGRVTVKDLLVRHEGEINRLSRHGLTQCQTTFDHEIQRSTSHLKK
jgi:hypothetical protein